MSINHSSAYCCGLHTAEARKLNIAQEKLDLLATWYHANIFDDNEKAALRWCEALTKLDKCCDKLTADLLAHFSEREVVDLTATIALMNALNRLAISLKA